MMGPLTALLSEQLQLFTFSSLAGSWSMNSTGGQFLQVAPQKLQLQNLGTYCFHSTGRYTIFPKVFAHLP